MDIKLSDWQRILFGNAPVEFLIEVLIRTVFTYLFLLVILRLLGKRMSGQLTSTEMAVMLVLGAIVSVPMQTPERGVLQGVFMLTLITLLQQGLTNWMRKRTKVEKLVQGTVSTLVKDGILQVKELDQLNISREQLFAVLRGKGIYNLGRVKRTYLEACGDFSTYERPEHMPGLSILPRKDNAVREIQQKTTDEMVCVYCGQVEKTATAQQACSNCHHQLWEQPIA